MNPKTIAVNSHASSFTGKLAELIRDHWESALEKAEAAAARIAPARLVGRKNIPPQKKVAIIGASSFCGREILATLRQSDLKLVGTGYSNTGSGLIKLDATSEPEIKAFIRRERPDVIIYVAGEADNDHAETNPSATFGVNSRAPELISRHFTGKLIYLSSTAIFSGKQQKYTTKSIPDPINVYGRSKLEGERVTLRNERNLIVRFSYAYGCGGNQDKNFIYKVAAHLNLGEPITADNKRIRRPLFTKDLARILLEAVNHETSGILQYCGPESVTQYQFARLIAEQYLGTYPFLIPEGMDAEGYINTIIIPAETSPYTAPRPASRHIINSPGDLTSLREGIAQSLPLFFSNRESDSICKGLNEALQRKDYYSLELMLAYMDKTDIRFALVGEDRDLPLSYQLFPPEQPARIVDELLKGVALTDPLLRKKLDNVIRSAVLDVAGSTGVITVRTGKDSQGNERYETAWKRATSTAASLNYQWATGYIAGMQYTPDRVVKAEVIADASDKAVLFPYEEILPGGSYSQVKRVIHRDGTTVIVKEADPRKDAGKLYHEAMYMRDMQSERFPKIYTIEHNNEKTTVTMEDVPGYQLSELVSVGSIDQAVPSLFELAKSIYFSLIPDFYSTKASETPPDFFARFHYIKLKNRWQEACSESPAIKTLFDIEYFKFMHRNDNFYPNLPLLIDMIAIFAHFYPHLLTPPYLSKEHGDLHFGNILVDPFTFFLRGDISGFKLIDPKLMPEGNDPLYDFGKIIHNMYGHYDLILNHYQTYHFVTELPVYADCPGITHEFFDDEAIGTLQFMSAIDTFTADFMHFLLSPDSSLPFEKDQTAWRVRLLFTHASLLSSLFPFHLLHNGREEKASLIHERSVIEFHRIVNTLFSVTIGGSAANTPEINRLYVLWNKMEEASNLKNQAAYYKNLQSLKYALALLLASVSSE